MILFLFVLTFFWQTKKRNQKNLPVGKPSLKIQMAFPLESQAVRAWFFICSYFFPASLVIFSFGLPAI